jgi:hypothetical protein
MEQEAQDDFPVTSIGDPPPPHGPAVGETTQEKVYKKIGGKQVGTVTLEHQPAGTGQASFQFEHGANVVFAGPVPGNGTWLGRSRFSWQRGTGRYKKGRPPNNRRDLDLESTNPKRWG